MENSIFKFKKVQSKKVGEFDLNDKTEYTLLIKTSYGDLPKFIHMHKLWNVTETPDKLDSDGDIEEKGIKAAPVWEQIMGFVKDGSYVVTGRRAFQSGNYHDIHVKYSSQLERYVEEGFRKDESLYNKSGNPVVPTYYANERTPMTEAKPTGAQSLAQSLGNAAKRFKNIIAGKQNP
jgi:hypothetical protein